MNLSEQINADFLAAMKNKQVEIKSTLGMIKSAITLKEKELIKKLTDNEIIEVINSYNKKLFQTIEAKEKANLDISAEKNELEITNKYLPIQLSSEKIEEIINNILKEISVEELKIKNKIIGTIMKYFKENHNGLYNNNNLKQIIDKKLN